jgi:hypothetical protein
LIADNKSKIPTVEKYEILRRENKRIKLEMEFIEKVVQNLL